MSLRRAFPIGRVIPVLLLCLGGLGGASLRAQEAVRAGIEVPFQAGSPHPYATGTGTVPVWSVTVDHPGATYIAVHFDRFELGPGDRAVVRSESGRQRHFFTGKGKGERGTFWATHIKGDRAVVELYSPEPHDGAWGLSIDKFAAGVVDMGTEATESVCGEDDRQNATCFLGSQPEMYDKSRAVARLLIEGTLLCTGWLVGCEGHLLSNNHCFDGPQFLPGIDPADAVVNTDYEFGAEAACGDPGCQLCSPGGIWSGTATLIQRSFGMDYAFIQLSGNPDDVWGSFLLEDRPAVADERIFFPQHPGGRAKEIGFDSTDPNDQSGFCEVSQPAGAPCGLPGEPANVRYYCDSEGGSSGSPIAAFPSNNVIALHHCGGCTNSGLRIEDIINDLGSKLPACAIAGPMDLEYTRFTVDDSIGNGNGIIDPGEQPELRLELFNTGDGLLASGVSGTIGTTTMENVAIVNDNAAWLDIPQGFGKLSSLPAFLLDVGGDVPCGSVIDFALDVTTDQGPFSFPFSITVGGAGNDVFDHPSTDTPIAIPDNSPQGIDSTLPVADSHTIDDLTVSVDITHTAIGDLVLDLVSPSGTRVTLHERTGDNTDNLVTTYDTLTASVDDMAAFDGEDAAGTWTLEVKDRGNGETGTLNSWMLHVESAAAPVCTPVPCSVTARAVATPDSACEGETIVLSDDGSSAFGTTCSGPLEFRFEDSGQVLQDWSTSSSAMIAAGQSTTFTVRVRDQGSGDEDADFPSVTVQPASPATITQVEEPACIEFDQVDLDAGPGFVAYVWRDDGDQVVGGSQTLALDASACGRTYTVEVDNGNGCIDSTSHVVTCEVCTPEEVSAPAAPVPYRILDANGTMEFELLPDPAVQYALYNAGSLAAMAAGDYTYKFCDLENNGLGIWNPVDADTVRWELQFPSVFFEGYWMVIAERQGIEGTYGSDSAGVPRPVDGDGAGSLGSPGCP